MQPKHSTRFPTIPNKRYFTISEASDLCGVKSHVLRYWEQEFPMLAPMKRRGNRRYYQPDDIKLIRKIYYLLYEQGYTINGARRELGAPQQQANHSLLHQEITEEISEIAAILS